MAALPRTLEAQLGSELKLSRIERGGRLAEISAAAVPMPEGVDNRIERICSSFVETVEQIEHLADQIQAHAVAKADLS